jgi:hypothetical protein
MLKCCPPWGLFFKEEKDYNTSCRSFTKKRQAGGDMPQKVFSLDGDLKAKEREINRWLESGEVQLVKRAAAGGGKLIISFNRRDKRLPAPEIHVKAVCLYTPAETIENQLNESICDFEILTVCTDYFALTFFHQD